MSRKKFIFQAPGGGEGECVIDGTYYWPEEDDHGRYVIEVTNPSHLPTLARHGFTLIHSIDQLPAPTSFGSIDYDEMGKTELQRALQERGVTFDRDGGREAMIESARAWNDMRRGRVSKAERAREPTLLEQVAAMTEAEKAKLLAALQGPSPALAPVVVEAGSVLRKGEETPRADWADPLLAAADRISEMKQGELRDLLTKAEVGFNPSTPVVTLRRIATAEIERRRAA